jgi:hypothetical protein
VLPKTLVDEIRDLISGVGSPEIVKIGQSRYFFKALKFNNWNCN